MSIQGAGNEPASGEIIGGQTTPSVERRIDRVEAGELDVVELFAPIVEAVSPSFAAGECDSAGYGGSLSLKRGYEIRPGEFVESEVTYRVQLARDYAAVTVETEDYMAPEPETDGAIIYNTDEDEDEDDERGIGGLSTLEIDGDDDEAPNTIVTTLACVEERSHEIAELPKAWMDLAEKNGWLRHDGTDTYFMQQTSAYIIFLSDGVIEREIICQYNVNGESFSVGIDIDGVVVDDVIEVTELTNPLDQPIGGEPNDDIEEWDSQLRQDADVSDFDTEAADFISVAALSRQFKTRDRRAEYAGQAANIIWQVLHIPVTGFTDKQTPNRL